MGFTCPPLIPHLVCEIKLKKKKLTEQKKRVQREDGEGRTWSQYSAVAGSFTWLLQQGGRCSKEGDGGGRKVPSRFSICGCSATGD